jgi:hypothetical protein
VKTTGEAPLEDESGLFYQHIYDGITTHREPPGTASSTTVRPPLQALELKTVDITFCVWEKLNNSHHWGVHSTRPEGNSVPPT